LVCIPVEKRHRPAAVGGETSQRRIIVHILERDDGESCPLSDAHTACKRYKVCTASSTSSSTANTFMPEIKATFNLIIQVFVIFPYSALTIQRQRRVLLANTRSDTKIYIQRPDSNTHQRQSIAMISDKVYKLCTSNESVSSLLAKDPAVAPGEAWKKLYGCHAGVEKESKATARAHRDNPTAEDLKRALECGNWGPTEPSELFLRASNTF